MSPRLTEPEQHIWKWNSLAQKLHSKLGPSSRTRFQVPSQPKLLNFCPFYLFLRNLLLFSCGATVFNRWSTSATYWGGMQKLQLRLAFLCPVSRWRSKVMRHQDALPRLGRVRVQGRVCSWNTSSETFTNLGCLFELLHHIGLI